MNKLKANFYHLNFLLNYLKINKYYFAALHLVTALLNNVAELASVITDNTDRWFLRFVACRRDAAKGRRFRGKR